MGAPRGRGPKETAQGVARLEVTERYPKSRGEQRNPKLNPMVRPRKNPPPKRETRPKRPAPTARAPRGEKTPKPAGGPPAGRPPGRPEASDAVFTPAVSVQVEEWWAQGMSFSDIARLIGCDWTTVRDHVRRHILPKWREMETCQRETLEAQVNHMQRVAMKKFEESTEPQTRKTIERALSKALAKEGKEGKDGEERQAKPQIVRRVLQKISRTGEVCWWGVIQWCIDWKTKVGGHYAAAKLQIVGPRSAGRAPEEHQREMLERMRAIYREAFVRRGGSSGKRQARGRQAGE